MLTETHLQPAKTFIERYRDVNELFLVHHDDRNDGRHHAFDLNMMILLSQPQFLNQLEQKFKSLAGKVEVIVAPNHEPGKKLGIEAANFFGCNLVIHDTLERSKIDAAGAELISNTKKLLIVDDVVNSGSRLKRYIQSLREGRYGEFDELNYLVAVARPSTPQNLEALAKSLTARHKWKGGFHAVEQIILPSWNEQHCPWCVEFDFISRIARKFPRPPQWLSERLLKLRNRLEGLTSEPLLLLPDVPSAVLGDQSPICSGGVSSMVTLFAVASALQAHRNDGDLKKQLHPNFPVGNILSSKNVKDRYTEGLIRAALLRLVNRAEWGQLSGIATRDLLISEVSNENQLIMGGELLFALGRASLPPLSRAQITAAFPEKFGHVSSAFVAT